MRPGGACALLALEIAGGGCGGVRVTDRRPSVELLWPADNPRVRLERVIELRRGGSRIAAVLGGSSDVSLFSGPYAAAWSGDDLWISDPQARRIVRVAANDRVTESQEGAAGLPVALAACPDGVVASDAEQGRIALLGLDLRVARWLATGLERPTGLACSVEGVFVVETGRHRIVRLAPDGSRREIGRRGNGPGEFNFPTALAISGDALYVGDTLNSRIQVLEAGDGAFHNAFGRLGDGPGDTPRIKGLAIDAEGHVWASDAHLDQVSLYTADGALLMSLGRHGSEPGEFSFPAGVAAHPDGRVAVVDSLNRRVQIFRLLGAAR